MIIREPFLSFVHVIRRPLSLKTMDAAVVLATDGSQGNIEFLIKLLIYVDES